MTAHTFGTFLILLGAILAAVGTFIRTTATDRSATVREQAAEVAKKTEEIARKEQAELTRRRHILAALRNQYLLSHDNITPEMMSGTAPLPKEWVEAELVKLGETWRQDQYH